MTPVKPGAHHSESGREMVRAALVTGYSPLVEGCEENQTWLSLIAISADRSRTAENEAC